MGSAGALALLAGFLLLRRRGPPDNAAADSTTQIAALKALPEAARAADAGAAPEPVAEPVPAPESAATPPEALTVRAETLRSMREVAFGITLPPAHAQPPPLDEICTQIGAALVNIVEKPKYAPRRPMQLPKLMRAINDETVSRGELAQIIAGDPALAGNLLRLANSPFYRHGREPIESLDHAVALLGIEGLRSMIAAALLQPVFRISGGSFAHFGEITWEHSLYAAGAAEGHASLIDTADPFAAQLLALVLGLATIVVFSLSRDMYLAHQKSPEAVTLAALIDLHAISVARQIAASWELSERIDTALSEQSAPEIRPASALGRALEFGEFIGALAVLRRRGVIDDQTAFAVLHSIETASGANERIWARLGLTAD
jgi:HD-like signal output (HDOD) protein